MTCEKMRFREYLDPVEKRRIEKAKEKILFFGKSFLFLGIVLVFVLVPAFVVFSPSEKIKNAISVLLQIAIILEIFSFSVPFLEGRKILKILQLPTQ